MPGQTISVSIAMQEQADIGRCGDMPGSSGEVSDEGAPSPCPLNTSHAADEKSGVELGRLRTYEKNTSTKKMKIATQRINTADA